MIAPSSSPRNARYLKKTGGESGDSLTVYLYDIIDTYWFDANALSAALEAAHDVEQIIVRINSPGGNAFMGAAVYNLLREHSAEVIVKIDGVAASAASLVAMAGDQILIGEGAEIMIHNPWSYAAGDWRRMEKLSADLRKAAERYAAIYVSRSGQKTDKVLQWMNEETFFSAEEAVKLGFATGHLLDDTVEADETAASLFKPVGRRNLDEIYKERLAGHERQQSLRDRHESIKLRNAVSAQKIAVAEKIAASAVKGV